jgi:nitroreductase
MDIEAAIRERRSIRKYSQEKVKKEDVLSILELAMWAPSACNRQAHRVIYIEKNETKKKLVDNGGAPFLKNVPAVLLFLYDDTGDNVAYRDDIQSSSALIENFLLLAHSKGLGATWVCQLPSKRTLRSIFNIPRGITPVAAVSIGYPDGKPSIVKRKHKVEEIFFEEKLAPGIEVPERNLSLFLKRSLRRLYYMLPAFIKRKVNPYVDNFFVKKFEN